MKRSLHVRHCKGSEINGYYMTYPELLATFASKLTLKQAEEMKAALEAVGVFRVAFIGGGTLFVTGTIKEAQNA